MVASIIVFLIVFAFRLVLAYLETFFSFLSSWNSWIDIALIVLACVVAIFILLRIRKEFNKSSKN